MKNLNFLMLLLLLAFSCSKTSQEDLCEGVVCKNGGSCVNGDCSCPPGYTGPDCGQEKAPVKMRISSITLTDFPPTDAAGAGWDVFDGPDVYLVIKQGATVIYTSGYVEDLSSGYVYNDIIEFSDPQATYSIGVFDYDDGLTTDDFMGSINFTPFQPGQNFPATYEVKCTGCQVSFIFSGAVYTH